MRQLVSIAQARFGKTLVIPSKERSGKIHFRIVKGKAADVL
jgi:hypothetical protein